MASEKRLATRQAVLISGTPEAVMALGAVFSALEVVPLALLGVEAYKNYQRSKAAPWVSAYKWPILCFVSVGFWNAVGAGLLGFAMRRWDFPVGPAVIDVVVSLGRRLGLETVAKGLETAEQIERLATAEEEKADPLAAVRLAAARPVQMYTSRSSRLNARPSVTVRQTTTVAHTTMAVHRTTRSHLLRRVGSWVYIGDGWPGKVASCQGSVSLCK